MPIAASLPTLQAQIINAFNLGPAAQPDLVGTLITQAVATSCVTGLLPSAPSPIPLTPSGFSNGLSQIKSAFNQGAEAQTNLVAQKIAQGVSVIAPIAPASGVSALQSQINNAFNLGATAQPNLVATMISQAIIQYYIAGGII